MVAVDEFDLGVQARSPAPAPASRRRRSDRPVLWVALALVLAVVGVLTVPPTLPRSMTTAPGWAGLMAVDYVFVDEDVTDPVASVQSVVAGTVFMSNGQRAGAVTVIIHASSPDDPALELDLLDRIGAGVNEELIPALEATGLHTDWVCDPIDEQMTCTAVADPQTVVVLDWPAS